MTIQMKLLRFHTRLCTRSNARSSPYSEQGYGLAEPTGTHVVAWMTALLFCIAALLLCIPQLAWAVGNITSIENEKDAFDHVDIAIERSKLTDTNPSSADAPEVIIYDTENFAVSDYTGGSVHIPKSLEGLLEPTFGRFVYYKGPNSPGGSSEASDWRVVGNTDINAAPLVTIRYKDAAVEPGTKKVVGDVLISLRAIQLRTLTGTQVLHPTSNDARRSVFRVHEAELQNTLISTKSYYNVYDDMRASNDVLPGAHTGGAGTHTYITVSIVKPGTDTPVPGNYRLHVYDIDQPSYMQNVNGEWLQPYSHLMRESIELQDTTNNNALWVHANTTLDIHDNDGNVFLGSTQSDPDISFASGFIIDMPEGVAHFHWRSGALCGTQLGLSLPDSQGPIPDQTPTKTVDTQEAHVGDTLHFSASQPVPKSELHYPSFVFTDSLQANLALVENSVRVLDGDTDITGQTHITYKDNVLTIELLGQYLAQQSLAGQSVTVTFDATVESCPENNLIHNRGLFKIGPFTLETNTTETHVEPVPDPTPTPETTPSPIPASIQNGSYTTSHKHSKPASNTPVATGSSITYFLDVTNTASQTALYTHVRDYVPEGTTYVDASVSEGGVYVAADAQGNTEGRAYVEWILTDIAANDTATTSFSVTVNDNAPALIENYALTAEIDRALTPGDTTNPEPTMRSNVLYHPTTNEQRSEAVPTPAYIDITKSSDPLPGTITAGQPITYTLQVTNTGGTAAHNVAVYDAIPQGTTLVSFNPVHKAAATEDNLALGWNIALLPAGQSVDLVFKVEALTEVTSEAFIDNQASWASDTPGVPSAPLENTTNIVQHYLPMPNNALPEVSPQGQLQPDPVEEATPITPKQTQKSGHTPSDNDDSAAARALGKTGDYLRAHPWILLVGGGLSAAGIAFWLMRYRKRRWRRYLLMR